MVIVSLVVTATLSLCQTWEMVLTFIPCHPVNPCELSSTISLATSHWWSLRLLMEELLSLAATTVMRECTILKWGWWLVCFSTEMASRITKVVISSHLWFSWNISTGRGCGLFISFHSWLDRWFFEGSFVPGLVHFGDRVLWHWRYQNKSLVSPRRTSYPLLLLFLLIFFFKVKAKKTQPQCHLIRLSILDSWNIS